MAKWDESKHPRERAGTPLGGKFRSKVAVNRYVDTRPLSPDELKFKNTFEGKLVTTKGHPDRVMRALSMGPDSVVTLARPKGRVMSAKEHLVFLRLAKGK